MPDPATPRRATAGENWPALRALLVQAFAGMEGRIDPPSSLHRLTTDDIARQAQTGEIWLIGRPVTACVFLTPQPGTLYVGKLAVADAARGRGQARALIGQAETRAMALGLPALELSARVELTENHTVFRALGFVKVAETAHPGFDRPTSFTFRKPVAVQSGRDEG